MYIFDISYILVIYINLSVNSSIMINGEYEYREIVYLYIQITLDPYHQIIYLELACTVQNKNKNERHNISQDN